MYTKCPFKKSWHVYCNLIFLIIKQTNNFAGWNTERKSCTEGYVHHWASGQDCHCGVWGKSNCFHVASQMWFLHAPHLYQSKKTQIVWNKHTECDYSWIHCYPVSWALRVPLVVIQIFHTSKLNRSLSNVLLSSLYVKLILYLISHAYGLTLSFALLLFLE